MRGPELRQRFSSPAVSRTVSPSQSRSASFTSLEALEEGQLALELYQDEEDEEPLYYSDDSTNDNSIHLVPCSMSTTLLFPTEPKLLPRIQRPSREFVPDKEYRDYLFGDERRKGSNGLLDCCDGPTCARGCAFFSWVAIMFLVFVGILIDKQPLYIQGVRLKSYSADGQEQDTSDASSLYSGGQRLPAAENAYATAGAYFITMLVCMAFLHSPQNVWTYITSRIRRRQYHTIPDAVSDRDSVIPVFHNMSMEADSSPIAADGASYRHRRRKRRQAPRALELWNFVGRKAQSFWKPTPKAKRR